MSGLVEGILQLHGMGALGLLFLFTALEAPAFIGLVLPGELALVLRRVAVDHVVGHARDIAGRG